MSAAGGWLTIDRKNPALRPEPPWPSYIGAETDVVATYQVDPVQPAHARVRELQH